MSLIIAHPQVDSVGAQMKEWRLSDIAQQVGKLLAQAAELQGGGLNQPQRQGEMLVRLQAPGAEARCARAAARCLEDAIKDRIKGFREAWEDHSEATMFFRLRLEELEAALLSASELPTVAYWMAAREPDRFCRTQDCGASLRSSAEIQRHYCDACWMRQAVRS